MQFKAGNIQELSFLFEKVMAQCNRYFCNNCGKFIEVWSDGNPYYLDENGAKQYAYHPDHENLKRCIGNDIPFYCLGCGEEFFVDSRVGDRTCPQCLKDKTIQLGQALENVPCPHCRRGTFRRDDIFFVIS